MAVIVRSVPRAGARLPRALAAAGVPVTAPAASGPLAEQPAVRALLTVLLATADGLDGQRALALLTGPIGRVDPVSLRQLRRNLQRANAGRPPGDFAELLVEALTGTAPPPGALFRALRRVRAVLDAAGRCHRDGQDPRYILWAAWHRSGLQRRWLSVSERGGPAAAQAGRDLDSVTALFDITDDYVSRTSGACCAGWSSTSPRCSCPAPAPCRWPPPSRSACSARTPRWAANGISW